MPTVVISPLALHGFVRAYLFQLAPCGVSRYVRACDVSEKLRKHFKVRMGFTYTATQIWRVVS